ncbi:hypothetical protein Cni_G08118 [Canna indica]|uniref:Uncharacterized protein n=1 Tax=Canna indica TaxID=4628 RepID=A0AAQ3JZU6_9LILI|nr:hypothetical protein Cni_G08118 [Canna indica]
MAMLRLFFSDLDDQAKQKRNGRKGKDKGKDERCNPVVERLQQEASVERISHDFSSEQAESVVEKIDALEDASDVSDTGDDVGELLQPDLDDRDSSPNNWDTDISEIHLATEANGNSVQNGQTEKRSQSVMDDSSSTCSTDSVPSALVSGPCKGSTLQNNNITQSSPNRVKNQRSKEKADRICLTNGGHNRQSETILIGDHLHHVAGSKVSQPQSDDSLFTLKIETRPLDNNINEKEEVATQQKKLTSKDRGDADRQFSSPSLGKRTTTILQQAKQSSVTTASLTVSTTGVDPASSKEPTSGSTSQTGKVIAAASRSPPVTSRIQSEAQKQKIPVKISSIHEVSSTTRPSSAPLVPAPRVTAIASTVQSVPFLSRSASAAGRLGTDPSSSAPSPSAPCYVPQSYRNATIGKTVNARGYISIDDTASSGQNVACPQSPSISLSSSSMRPPQTPIRKDLTSIRPGLTFGCVNPKAVHIQHLGLDDSYHESTASSSSNERFGLMDNLEKLDIYGKLRKKLFATEIASRVTPYVQGTVTEEFPHLDIINDLLDDDQHIGRTARGSHHAFSRQYSLPGNLSSADIGSLGCSSRFDQSKQYFDVGARGYSASNNPIQGLRDGHYQQLDYSAYANNRFDGLSRSSWPYGNGDLSMLSLGDGDTNGYGYQFSEYSARGGTGYVYRPNEP